MQYTKKDFIFFPELTDNLMTMQSLCISLPQPYTLQLQMFMIPPQCGQLLANNGGDSSPNTYREHLVRNTVPG